MADRPLIIASLGGKDRIASGLEQAARAGADLIEIRVDTFPAKERGENVSDVLSEIRNLSRLPLIATVRSPREQGPRPGAPPMSEAERRATYLSVLPFVDWVDVEIESRALRSEVIAAARAQKKKVILSYHRFRGLPGPEKLAELASQFRALGGDVFKVAATPRTKPELEQFIAYSLAFDPWPRVFVAMGRFGAISRILAGFFGSCFSYGYLIRPTAPGQISVQELKKEFDRLYGR